MRVGLIIFVALVAVLYYYMIPTEVTWVGHFSPSRRFPPARLFHGLDSKNEKIRGNQATINLYSRRQEFKEAKSSASAILLFLHGMPESARVSWDSTASLLESASLNYRSVIFAAFDLRGYNKTVVDPGASFGAFAVDRSADDVVLVVDHLKKTYGISNPEVHLVGHDLGAIVAWSIWHKSILHDSLKAVTIVNVAHLAAYWDVFPYSDQLLRSWYILFFQLPSSFITNKIIGNNASFLELVYTSTKKGDMYQGDLDDLKQTWLNGLEGMLSYYRAIIRYPTCQSVNCLVKKTKVPVNIIWGMNDWVFSPKMLCQSRKAALEFGAPQVDVFPLVDANHFVNIERPDVIAAVVTDQLNGGARKTSAAFLQNDFCA